MTPIVHGLETEFVGRANVLRLDANETENARVQQGYGLRGHPTFAVLDENGRVTQSFIGPQPESVLRAALEAVIPATN
jgi:thioredoxin-like negative regulator of GroEL